MELSVAMAHTLAEPFVCCSHSQGSAGQEQGSRAFPIRRHCCLTAGFRLCNTAHPDVSKVTDTEYPPVKTKHESGESGLWAPRDAFSTLPRRRAKNEGNLLVSGGLGKSSNSEDDNQTSWLR